MRHLKQQTTPIHLVGRSNKYTKFDINAGITPFDEIENYHLKGDFKEFSLPAVSSYMRDASGLEIKTGQLDIGFEFKLAGDQLNGNVNVLLGALETGIKKNDEVGNLIDQGAQPLNLALGMLKDGDANVALAVPVSGSLSDSKFGLRSIVSLITQKAIMSVMQGYLMQTFVPYANIVSVAFSAGEFALKLCFDDLMYQVAQIESNAA